MSTETKDPSTCPHANTVAVPVEKTKPVVNLNGRGLLRPALKCTDCGTTLYVLSKKSDEEHRSEG